MTRVDHILNECLSGPHKGELTARRVSRYFTSPFYTYCEVFVPESKKDPISPYQEMLQQRGIEHERDTIESLCPGAVSIVYENPREGFCSALEQMTRGMDTICGAPLFYLPEDLQGRADALIKSTDHSSIFGPYHYTVLEIKLAKNIRKDHILQAAFYNYLLGRIQGYTPSALRMVTRDQEIKEYDDRDFREPLRRSLHGTRAILNGRENPTATYNGCDWPWSSYANGEAVRNRDVSLVSRVGLQWKRRLTDFGYHKVKDIASASVEDLSSALGMKPGRANQLKLSATAIEKGEPILIDPSAPALPEAPVEIFLDLEGIDHPSHDEKRPQIDYLIGTLIRRNGHVSYHPFFASRVEDEGKMFREFMSFMRKQKDYVIYHWHNYERWHIKQLSQRHGFREEVESWLLSRMIDLHRVATRAVVFPTYRNGLKDIAGYLGFKWRHGDVNALDAIAYYLGWQTDPEAYEDRIRVVLDYNEDDCIATSIIKDWIHRIRKKDVDPAVRSHDWVRSRK